MREQPGGAEPDDGRHWLPADLVDEQHASDRPSRARAGSRSSRTRSRRCCRCGELLGGDDLDRHSRAPPSAPAARPAGTLASPGRRITSTPARPSTTAPMRLAVMRSPRKNGASSDRPGRHGEFEREHGRERQQQQAQRPQILRAEMDGVAQQMQAERWLRDRRAAARAAAAMSASMISKPDGGAHGENFERCSSALARPRIETAITRERQQRAGHPEDDANEVPVATSNGPLRAWSGANEWRRGCSASGSVHSASGWFSGRACRRPAAWRRPRRSRRSSG